MSDTYSEYIGIRDKYWAEITPNSIKNSPDDWKFTYPHKTFIELLKATERMLARGPTNDRKSIWIEGAYGTGKSRVAWTIEMLLKCSAEELTGYFNTYPQLQELTDLRDKLLSEKDEIIVTAYRYASGNIDTTRKLIMAVYESIVKSLDEQRIRYKGENTLRGKVAEWLSDDVRKEFFSKIIIKPEYRSKGSFSGKSVDSILEQLNNKSQNVDLLLSDIFDVAELEGISAFNISIDDLTKWIADIIDANHLKAIVLIWDEFSSFFKNNKNSLDELQKLAELSSYKPFYLMIVTHMAGVLTTDDNDAQGKSIRDRFIRKEITMPDNIAFELMSHALVVKQGMKENWAELSTDLNGYMPESRKEVSNAVQVPEETLTRILPIHPMAALLLKNISVGFASNQRSMFNFIKNESAELHAFQWFIANKCPEDEEILTIDYLWDFFYEKGTDEHGVGAGRSNLDTIIRTILDTYSLNESRLLRDERKVLQTVLMMQAISQKFGDSIDLLLPSSKNLNLAFEGTQNDNNFAISIANKLVRMGILYEKPGVIPTYAAAAVSGDSVAIDKTKARMRTETKTIQLVGNFDNVLVLKPSLLLRYIIKIATIDNFNKLLITLSNEKKDWHIRGVLCIARDEAEQVKLHTYITDALKKSQYNNLVIIDASSSIMGLDIFEQWVDASANEEYWRTKDKSLADNMKNKATSYIDAWKTSIYEGSFAIYPSIKENQIPRTGCHCNHISDLHNALVSHVLEMYPLSFDNANLSESFFTITNLPAGAKCGVTQTSGGIYQKDKILMILNDVWDKGDDKYWERLPNLPISKLKIEIDSFITKGFESSVRLSIVDIFNHLIGLGFVPCNLYALLTGFLLKEYSLGNQYRYGLGSYGDEGGVLDGIKLAEYIGTSIKHVNIPFKNFRTPYIEITTQYQRAFVEFAHDVYGIDNTYSVEAVVNSLRVKVNEVNCPIWCYKSIDNNNLGSYLDKLAELLNSQSTSASSIADKLGDMLIHSPDSSKNLRLLLTKENGIQALNTFLDNFESGILIALGEKIGVNDILNDVRQTITSGDAPWLWDQKTGEDEIRKLIIDYKIMAATNKFGLSCNSWQACINAWKDKAKSTKIPCSVFINRHKSLKDFFESLLDIVETNNLYYDKRIEFLDKLDTHMDEILDIFSNVDSIFYDEYSVPLSVGKLNHNDAKKVRIKMSLSSFSDDGLTYRKGLDSVINAIKEELEKLQLLGLWEEVSATKTPKDWSDRYRTPIISIVPENEQEAAKRLFETLNSNNPDAAELQFSIDYLKSNPEYLQYLQNQVEIDKAFQNTIIGKYASILTDINEVRDFISGSSDTEIYSWYPNAFVLKLVEKLATEHYYSNGYTVVETKIDHMPPDKAKEFLKRLIRENPNVGIEILSKGDE